jgi:hypothetical protein
MISTLKHWVPLATAICIVATPAFSQAPTDAQRNAIRSECRSDYEAHCASIPPGGAASLQCLQKNMSSLAPGCQAAVKAVEAPAAEPKAETGPAAAPAKGAETAAPAATPKASTDKASTDKASTDKASADKASTAKPAATTSAKKPSSAQISAIRSACRADYQKVCAGVPTGGAPALQCLEKNKSKVSAGCATAVSAATGGGAAAPVAGGAPAADTATATPGAARPGAAAPPRTLVLRPMRPREQLFVLRSACGADVRSLCAGVEVGGGRVIQCLASQAASLSPACKDVLGQFAAQ